MTLHQCVIFVLEPCVTCLKKSDQRIHGARITITCRVTVQFESPPTGRVGFIPLIHSEVKTVDKKLRCNSCCPLPSLCKIIYYLSHICYIFWSASLVSDYLPWGRRFDSRHFHSFKCALGLEQGPPSLVRTIGYLFDAERTVLIKQVDINILEWAQC